MELSEDLLSMVINSGFCTKILGDIDLEGMVIFVCYDDQIIAEVNYEKGVDNIEIDFLALKDDSHRYLFPLEDFLKILEQAKAMAIRCAKKDDLNN